MSEQYNPYPQLGREDDRVALKINTALNAARLPKKGWPHDVPDVVTFWESIGCGLVSIECAGADREPSTSRLEHIALAVLKAIDERRTIARDDVARERHEAVKTLLRLATIDGEPVAP